MMQRIINEIWTDCLEVDLTAGEQYRISVGQGGWQQQCYIPPDLRALAVAWRDSELYVTDWIVQITDHPKHSDYLTYRQALRDWPASASFPTVRPVL